MKIFWKLEANISNTAALFFWPCLFPWNFGKNTHGAITYRTIFPTRKCPRHFIFSPMAKWQLLPMLQKWPLAIFGKISTYPWHVLKELMTKLNLVPDLLGNNLLPNNEAQCAYQRENSKQSENVGQLEKFRSSQYFAAQVIFVYSSVYWLLCCRAAKKLCRRKK